MTKYVANLSEIVTVVSDHYGIPAEVIMSPRMRSPAVSNARHIAIYLACKMTWMTKKDIAGCFNQKDHSSIFYGFNKVSKLMADDAKLKKQVDGLAKKLEPKG